MVDPLTKLAITYGTDKFGYHDYTPNYYRLFKHLKNKPIKLLEIGVGGYQDVDRGGESLEVWRDFFTKATIVGIDIQKKELDLGPRVLIEQGSQVDSGFLADLVRDHGPFDIIIDDGSHRNEHVVQSFELLFPTLAKGGIYVVEDVQTAFFPRFGGSADLKQPNSVGYFAGMQREFDSGRLAKSDPDAAALLAGVSSISRFHNMVALHKQPKKKPTKKMAELVVLLKPLKQKPIRLLEIGAGPADQHGKTSLEMWRDYFPKGQMVGLRPAAKGADYGERVTIAGRKLNATMLKKLTKTYGPFDVVIDHGSDNWNGIDLFEQLFPELNDGGFFVAKPTDAKARTYFQNLFIDVDHREIAVFFPKKKSKPLARQTYAMWRANAMIALQKGPNDYPSNFRFDFDNPQACHALNQMEKVLERGGRERGFLLFADIMTRAGDEKRAGRMLKKLATIGAVSRPYFNLAVRQAKLDKDWQGAMALLAKAVKIHPDDYRIRSQLGSVFSKERDWHHAAREFETGIQLAPRDPLLRIQLAGALSRMGRASDAVQSAEIATELAPKHAGHHVQLGRLQIDADQFEQATQTLNKALALNPEVANAHRQLSRAYAALGQQAVAMEMAKEALLRFPGNPEYLRWQAHLAAA